MPQLGETVTEGTVTKWLKKIGDSVAQDEIIFEVSTDKVDSEVPSSAAGVLTQILVEEGETVDVGTVLAVISSGAEVHAPTPASAPAPEPAREPVVTSAPTPAPEPVVASAPAPEPAREPVVTSAPTPAPEPVVASAPAPASESASSVDDGILLLSPVVRKLIHENEIDPADIVGTGAGGRITRSDVLSFLDRRASGGANARPESQAPAPVSASAASAAQQRPITIPDAQSVVTSAPRV